MRQPRVLQGAYVTFGLGLSIGAYGGLDEVHRDPQAMRDVGRERAAGTDRGRVVIRALEVVAAEVAEDVSTMSEDRCRTDTARTVHRLTGAAAADPFAAGAVIATGETEETLYGDGGLRVWAGKVGDLFRIEPDVLHAVGHAFQDSTTIDLGSWTPEPATNHFAGHTVYSIVLEIPTPSCSTLRRRPGRSASGRSRAWPRTRVAGVRSTGSGCR